MTTPAVRADRIRSDYQAKRRSRENAIAAMREVLSVTEVGAADLLDHALTPSRRYAR